MIRKMAKPKIRGVCEWCGKAFEKIAHPLSSTRFCSRRCSLLLTNRQFKKYVATGEYKNLCANQMREPQGSCFPRAKPLKPVDVPTDNEPPYDFEHKTNLIPICRNEKEFAAWFDQYFWIFGLIEITHKTTLFPDRQARLPTGDVIKVELEYDARNFNRHGHNCFLCDLIVSYTGPSCEETINGVPVMSVYTNYGNKISLSPHTRRIMTTALNSFGAIKPKGAD